jgi:membrane protein DedA with SNARE-associated domain
MRATDLPKKNGSGGVWKSILGFGGDEHGKPSKYWHYLLVISILIMSLSILALLNAYFHLINIPSYNINQGGVSSPYLLMGYLGMFISIAFLPLPDYFLVPAYGYLSLIGFFNPYYTFLVCVVGAVFPVEYVCGRFAARPVLLKVMSLFHISEKSVETADKWLVEHGLFSIFISTFIPFFYGAISLAAGTLKMKSAVFLISSAAGFGVRFVFLEAVGYYSIYIFTASFAYSQRALFSLLLILSSVYVAFYLVRTLAGVLKKRTNVFSVPRTDFFSNCV